MDKTIDRDEQIARDSARERIRNYLDDHGLTEREFANLIGWTRASLHNYLADMVDLPPWLYPRVTRVMQTTKTELRWPLGPADYQKENTHGK